MPTSATMPRTAVVGAGVAGLTAARRLVAAGHEVTVWDKGHGVGGRLATRRAEGPWGTARFDHGAQFFTVRGDELRAEVAPLLDEGLVRVWAEGFGPEPDGHPRYAVRDGMTALAKHWAHDLDVRTGVRITDLGEATVGPDDAAADAWVVTAPSPQAVELLAASGAVVPPVLHDVTWEPTLVALLVLDADSGVPDPGGLPSPDGFAFVADNRRKGISDVPCLTLHLDAATSAARWDDDEGSVLDAAVARAGDAGWFGGSAVVHRQLKRWRYATPTPLDVACLVTEGPGARRVVVAGDAFGGPKVEGAFTSGLAAAAALR